MSAGELDIDYLLFGEPAKDGWVAPLPERLERVEWWSGIFNVPCVAYAASLDEIAPLATAGADFVALGDAVWRDARGPASAMRDAAAALRQTTRAP
jgi:thiamine-phosphate pyrophosphorylase